MFDVSTGLEFARRLKHELKMTSTSEELFESFLNSINNKHYIWIDQKIYAKNYINVTLKLYTIYFLWISLILVKL